MSFVEMFNSVHTFTYDLLQVNSVRTFTYDLLQVNSVRPFTYDLLQVNSVHTFTYDLLQVNSVHTFTYDLLQVNSVHTFVTCSKITDYIITYYLFLLIFVVCPAGWKPGADTVRNLMCYEDLDH